MALTYTVFEDNNGSPGVAGGDTTTASRTYNSGELVAVLWVAETHTVDTVSIANSGTAQTWNAIGTATATDYCYVRGWYCVMSTTQAMTITCAGTHVAVMAGVVYTIQHAGQHATTPVPAGKVTATTDADGDVSVNITPTDANGSCLWLVCGDWSNDTDTYTAGANCTKQDSYTETGSMAVGLFRPTTQPRPDGAAFTISETDTAGKIAYLAFEVVAAAGGATSILRQMMMNQ